MKTVWAIAFLLFIGIIGLLIISPKRNMEIYMDQYQYSESVVLRDGAVELGQSVMCTRLLPYVLNRYRDERDIQFVVAMLEVCRTAKDHTIMWDFARAETTDQQVRIICLAHLLSRGYTSVWGEITRDDIDMIALSMPAHIAHWKQLVLQYGGYPRSFLKTDKYPERTKFKALFRKCIEKYQRLEEEKLMRNPHAISSQDIPRR